MKISSRGLQNFFVKLKIFLNLQLVTSWKPKEFNLASAHKPCNIHKNRDIDIIPIENARVHLTPKPGVDGSDYINATWFAGKFCKK